MRRHRAACLNVPVYPAFPEWLGHGPALGPMGQAWLAGDRKAAVVAVPPTEPDPARKRAILVSAVRALGPRAR